MRRNLLLVLMLMLGISPACAGDLTLNDLPLVLQKLRGCVEVKGTLYGTSTKCRIPSSKLWVSIDSEGALTLFSKKSYDDTTYARGKNVSELLRDFAATLNREQSRNKQMLEAIGQYLPTQ